MVQKQPQIKLLYAGSAFTLFWLDTGSKKHDVKPFLAGLSEGERKKALALLKWAADSGPPRNREKCRILDGESRLFEFKSYQVRIVFAYAGPQRILLLSGFTKKSRGTPQQEIQRARQRLALGDRISRTELRSRRKAGRDARA